MNPTTLRAGEWLWEKRRVRMGNTTMSKDAWYRVYVVETFDGGAVVRWNGNPPERRSNYQLRHLQRRRRIDGVLMGAGPR